MATSAYVRSLRDAVGHELVLVPSLALLVWDEAGRLQGSATFSAGAVPHVPNGDPIRCAVARRAYSTDTRR